MASRKIMTAMAEVSADTDKVDYEKKKTILVMVEVLVRC